MTKAILKQIPQVPANLDPAVTDFCVAVKQCLELYQGNIGNGDDVIKRNDLPDIADEVGVNADWESSSGLSEILNKPTLGTASALDFETELIAGSTNLPTSAAILQYAEDNWDPGKCDNISIGTMVLESSTWNAISVGNDNPYNFVIYDSMNRMPWIGAYRNSGVYLYYNGNRRLATTIDGVTITGDLDISGDFNIEGAFSIDDFDIGTFTIDAASWNAIKVSGERNLTLYNEQDSEPFISCYRNEGVLFYYNGSRKFETTTSGAKIIGYLDVSDSTDADPDFTIKLGPQTIDAATWQGLQISGEANFVIYDEDNSKAMLGAYRTEGVFLYYNGDKKIETTTNGVGITGYADITNLLVTMRVGPQTLDAATWQAIGIIGAANFTIYDIDNSKAMLGAYRAGGVLLYYNGSNKFETITSGGQITGYLQCVDDPDTPTYTMKIGQMTLDASPYQAISLTGAANFSVYDVDNSKAMIWAAKAGAVKLYYNGTSYIETYNGGALINGQIKITGGTPGASKVLTSDADGLATWTAAGSGDVTGPASSTDDAICRFDSTTGKLLQNSGTILDDTGNILFTSGGEPLVNNAKYFLCKDSSGNNRYGLGLTSSNYWQLCRDGVNVSIGYNCSDANPVMIRVNSTNDVVIERSAYTDGAGKHYLVVA